MRLGGAAAVVGGLGFLLAWWALVPAGRPLPPLLETPHQRAISQLTARLGPVRYSQGPEELVIRDFFQDERARVFLDVGSGDAVFDSNTAYLEKVLGWRGIAVDAEERHAPGYVRERPATRFFSLFVGDKDDGVTGFYVNDREWRLSSGVASNAGRQGDASREVAVKTITLNTLLRHAGIDAVDFLSMDIEGGEPAALRGFDIQRFRPRLVCIETIQPGTAAAIRSYMAKNGFLEITRYGPPLDLVNAYFRPDPQRGRAAGGAR